MHTTPLLFWEHGTLLQPQHFQLSDRRLLEETGLLRSFLCPHAWGVKELEIDEEALALGIFQVKRLDMLLPQGEHLVLGENAVLPSRGFAEFWTDPQAQLECRICLPLSEENAANVAEVPGFQPGDLEGATTRYVASEMPDAVRDAYANGLEADVRFMRYNARIVFSTEKDRLAKMPSWPLARLVREGDEVRLSPSYAAPCLDIASSPLLQSALLAVRKGKHLIGMNDLEEAMIRVIVGPAKKSRVITEAEYRNLLLKKLDEHMEGADGMVLDIKKNLREMEKIEKEAGKK